MLLRLWITVLLGHPKVDNVYNLSSWSQFDHVHCLDKYALTVSDFGPRSTDKKVIRLDVAVYQILVVDILHTRDLPWLVIGAAQLARVNAPSAAQPCTPS